MQSLSSNYSNRDLISYEGAAKERLQCWKEFHKCRQSLSPSQATIEYYFNHKKLLIMTWLYGCRYMNQMKVILFALQSIPLPPLQLYLLVHLWFQGSKFIIYDNVDLETVMMRKNGPEEKFWFWGENIFRCSGASRHLWKSLHDLLDLDLDLLDLAQSHSCLRTCSVNQTNRGIR